MKESIVANRAFQFAVMVIELTKVLSKNQVNLIIIRQLIRSVTSIGANIEEALGSNSRKDFTHCMNIAKKEARETLYWLRLLNATNHDINEQLITVLQENQEIVNMLTSIVKTTKSRQLT